MDEPRPEPPPVQVPPAPMTQPAPSLTPDSRPEDIVRKVIGGDLDISASENLLQAGIIGGFVVVAGAVCALLQIPAAGEPLISGLVGGFGGLVGGLLVSGLVLAIRRLLRR